MEWREFMSIALISIMEECVPKAKKAKLNAPLSRNNVFSYECENRSLPTAGLFKARSSMDGLSKRFQQLLERRKKGLTASKDRGLAKHLFIFSTLCHNYVIGHSDS